MEDIEDVVADAHYHVAVNTDNPKPTMKFEDVPKDKMTSLKADLLARGDYTWVSARDVEPRAARAIAREW